MKHVLIKSVEALKLNPRTLRPLGSETVTIPYGSILEKMVQDRDLWQFYYLGDPYRSPDTEIKGALQQVP